MRQDILILGDLFPKNIKSVVELPDNDFCVANLECAITDCKNKIFKDGPNLKVNPQSISLLTKLGVNLVGLANNHVLDFGIEGFEDTIKNLRLKKIEFAGCSVSKNYYTKTFKDKKICFYFISEHQYNYGFFEDYSVNCIKQTETFLEINELSKKSDFLIVLYHGGREYFKYPTPLQRDVCHKFVDFGADLVVCQHSHCVGTFEKYKGRTLVFGQGNFLFPYRNDDDFKTGLIIKLSVESRNDYNVDFLPIVHSEEGIVRFARDDEKKLILSEFENKSKILEKGNIDDIYDELITKEGLCILYRLFNKNKFYKFIDNTRIFKNKLIKRYMKKNKSYILYLYNYFNCETHSEFIKRALQKQIKEYE